MDKVKELWLKERDIMDKMIEQLLDEVKQLKAKLKEQAKEIMKDVECRMLMIWEGTITKTDLGAIELHTKIMDDMRERFNKIHRKWVGKE